MPTKSCFKDQSQSKSCVPKVKVTQSFHFQSQSCQSFRFQSQSYQSSIGRFPDVTTMTTTAGSDKEGPDDASCIVWALWYVFFL